MITGLARRISLRLKIILIVALVLVAVQYTVLPFIRWQQNSVEEVLSLQESIARKKALLEQQDQVERVFQESSYLRDQWKSNYIPGPTDAQSLQLNLQKKVEGLASMLEIRTSNVDWLPVAAEDMIRAPVRFRLESGPESLLKLLYSLENEARFISVDSISIDARPRSPTFTAELEISAYALSEALAN